jgi:hypothetical protein
MKKVRVVLAFLLLAGFVFGEKVAVLTDVLNPNPIFYPIKVDKDHIYVTDGLVNYIYSKANYKLLNVFGRRGEGPQEFKGYDNGCVLTTLTPEYLFVDSRNKISYFTKDGEFVKEIKVTSGYVYRAFEDRFVGFGNVAEGDKIFGTVFLYDKDLKEIKELDRFEEWAFQKKMNPYTFQKPLPIVYEGNLFLNDFVEGTIKVFNLDGKELYSINYNYPKVEVTDAHKKETIEFYKIDPRLKALFRSPEELTQRLAFPQYFPVMKQYDISDDKIYVLTYVIKDNKSEFIVFDIKGKFLEKKMIALPHVNPVEPSPYTIWGGKIYQIVENPETEKWELNITDF